MDSNQLLTPEEYTELYNVVRIGNELRGIAETIRNMVEQGRLGEVEVVDVPLSEVSEFDLQGLPVVRAEMTGTVQAMINRAQRARKAATGSQIECPVCREWFEKSRSTNVFCSNYYNWGPGACKDEFWMRIKYPDATKRKK